MIRGFIGFVAIFVLVTTLISVYLAPNGMKECGTTPDASKFECQKVDAIVAISGGDTAARTRQAIELYKNGWSETLILSGAAADKTGPSNAAAMRDQAIAAGIPASAILVDETSETTKQNAANTHDLFTNNDIHSVILVTSAYHQRRAGLEFGKRAGSEVRIMNYPVKSDNQWSAWWWTTPSGWLLASSELTKIIVFYAGATQ